MNISIIQLVIYSRHVQCARIKLASRQLLSTRK